MTNCWIFKVKDDSDGTYRLDGIEIYRHRMKDCSWGIKEFKKNGTRAKNVSCLQIGDKIVFYQSGINGHCFLGTAILKTGFPLVKLVVHKEYLDWDWGVELTETKTWIHPVSIICLEGKVGFFPKGEKNYGAYLQGAITKITNEEYETIKDESDGI